MKRCSHRYRNTCCLGSNGKHYRRIFQAEDTEWSSSFQCTDEMSEICEFREWTPRPKAEPKNPKSTWVQCQYCGGKHRTQETANTCRFYREQWSALEERLRALEPFKDEGSKEPWPPYATSLSDVNVWHAMVDKVIDRDQGCCTDCGLSFREFKAMQDAVGGHYWFSGGWSDKDAQRKKDQEVREITDLSTFPSFEVHHIIPRVKGGTHHPHNLRLLCSICHRKYTNELMGDLAAERQQAAEKERIESIHALHATLEEYCLAESDIQEVK